MGERTVERGLNLVESKNNIKESAVVKPETNLCEGPKTNDPFKDKEAVKEFIKSVARIQKEAGDELINRARRSDIHLGTKRHPVVSSD